MTVKKEVKLQSEKMSELTQKMTKLATHKRLPPNNMYTCYAHFKLSYRYLTRNQNLSNKVGDLYSYSNDVEEGSEVRILAPVQHERKFLKRHKLKGEVALKHQRSQKY